MGRMIRDFNAWADALKATAYAEGKEMSAECEQCPHLRAELAEARTLLRHALCRWRMYAEVYAAGDFETEKTIEGDMYRHARAWLDRAAR